MQQKQATEIDRNMKIKTGIEETDIVFYDAKSDSFDLYGLLWEERFKRIPTEVAEAASEGVSYMHTSTAGGRLRFVTDSEYVAISCKVDKLMNFSIIPLSGTCGFSLYADGIFKSGVYPALGMKDGFESIVHFGDKKMREIMIRFPIYCDVEELLVGVQEDAVIQKAPKYSIQTPVVFYGSSITQGGCMMRPGSEYVSVLSDWLDFDFINLGFAGNAKGEKAIAEYIAGLRMSAFVLDYDYNAPTSEFLESTHEPFFQTIRKQQPKLPILMISAPNFHYLKDAQIRREIIKRTYQNAKQQGDNKVWFIDGETLWGEEWHRCTIDCVHPNDLGGLRMAETIAPVLEKILKEEI